MSTPTISNAGKAFSKECQAATTALAANCKLWKPPFSSRPGASPGELIAQLGVAGSDNPVPEMRESQKRFAVAFKAAEEHLNAASEHCLKLWLCARWLKSGVPPQTSLTTGAESSNPMPVEIGEPLASYVRTLLDGHKAGLVDTDAIAKELLSLVNQGEDRIAAIRRSGRKYVSAAHIILTKSKAKYLAQFPAWSVGVPGLVAKADRLTALHRAQFPTHRKTTVDRKRVRSLGGAGA